MGSVEPGHKGDYTMALAKDKAKLAIAAVKSEDTQVKIQLGWWSILHKTFISVLQDVLGLSSVREEPWTTPTVLLEFGMCSCSFCCLLWCCWI